MQPIYLKITVLKPKKFSSSDRRKIFIAYMYVYK